MTITKKRLALAITAFALLIPATAYATHTFSDVPDGKFYTDAVEWAFDNGITTGTSATTFEPDAGVTRGQNVTFAKRYDDNIVQPALTELEADIAAITGGTAGPAGPAGADGPAGPGSLVVRVKTFTVAAMSVGTDFSPCNADEVATGGGVYWAASPSSAQYVVDQTPGNATGSIFTSSGQVPRSWRVEIYNGTGGSLDANISVICAPEAAAVGATLSGASAAPTTASGRPE
jgi:hypothetical protein